MPQPRHPGSADSSDHAELATSRPAPRRCGPSRPSSASSSTEFRRVAENANRVSPGHAAGAYKVFTTIVRQESITISALAEALLMDKGQISRTVRELENLGLVSRTPDPADGRSVFSPHAEGLERLAAARHPSRERLSVLERLVDRGDRPAHRAPARARRTARHRDRAGSVRSPRPGP